MLEYEQQSFAREGCLALQPFSLAVAFHCIFDRVGKVMLSNLFFSVLRSQRVSKILDQHSRSPQRTHMTVTVGVDIGNAGLRIG